MTPDQIALVQTTFKEVAKIKEAAAELFYGRLFEPDPSLRSLFTGDMAEQGRALMAMIATAVGGLTRLETIVPAVQDLGVRHVGYGVKDADYDTVAEALLWTLGQGLGEAFTDEVRDAWAAAYTLLATTMKDAANAAAAAPAPSPEPVPALAPSSAPADDRRQKIHDEIAELQQQIALVAKVATEIDA
ncbi:MAG: globin family protein, partial [Rhodospirillaceae bacterium]